MSCSGSTSAVVTPLSIIGSAPCEQARSVSLTSPVLLPRFVIPTQSAASPAMLSRAVPPAAGSLGRLSRSKSISGADCPPKSATSAILRRLWGTPQNCASSTRQAMENPSPMIHPAVLHFPFGDLGITVLSSAILAASSRTVRKSSPPFDENAPGTFSQTMYLGRTNRPVLPAALSRSLISFMIRICSMYKPDRSPESPARLPATLKS